MAVEPIILVSTNDGVATITLNRPDKRNAMNGALVTDLFAALTTIANDEDSDVLILKANGEHFCAGADIGWMQKMATSTQAENREDALQLARLLHAMHTFPKPVIVLAQGRTLGGGLGLVAASDIAIVGHHASFAFSEVKIGIVPSVVSPYVIAAMGERAARYYFLTAATFDAEEAYRMGLVHQVVDEAVLETVGLSIANEIRQHSQKAVREAKHLIHRISREKLTEALIQDTAIHLANMRSSAEAQEGLLAFLEKRIPNWS